MLPFFGTWTLKLTAFRTWEWMVGIYLLFFGFRHIFRGELAADSFGVRVCFEDFFEETFGRAKQQPIWPPPMSIAMRWARVPGKRTARCQWKGWEVLHGCSYLSWSYSLQGSFIPSFLSSTYYLEEYRCARLEAQLNLTELIKMQEWRILLIWCCHHLGLLLCDGGCGCGSCLACCRCGRSRSHSVYPPSSIQRTCDRPKVLNALGSSCILRCSFLLCVKKLQVLYLYVCMHACKHHSISLNVKYSADFILQQSYLPAYFICECSSKISGFLQYGIRALFSYRNK